MKAKDLAALAALGVAGYAAYDKFNKKPAAGKAAPVYDYDTSAQKAEPETRDPYLEDINELRTRGAYHEDSPEFRTKDAYIPERAEKSSAKKSDADARAAYAKLKAAGSNSKTPAAALKTVSGSVAATPAAAAAPAAEQPVYDNYSNEGRNTGAPAPAQMPDAARVNPYNSDIMYADTVKSDPNVAHDDEMNRLARGRATRQGAVVAQSPNAQAQARILRQGPTPAQSATNAQAQARMLRQGTSSAQTAPVVPAAQTGRYTKDQYGNIVDNTTGKVSRTIFSAGQEGNAARNGMKRGGSVKKMASGGLASSKMSSKPQQSTASSRGDGIAQRGKTRGMMR
jgi:hypothetical protein